MVSVSLRQNRAATPDRNTHDDQAVTLPEDGRFALSARRNRAGIMMLVQQPFYRHPNLGPGAPLVEIPGTGETAGFYDWAGRRLFLADSEPDPACPGVYRHQHNPSTCDVDAPDSDPRSPRYEPEHLRHRSGDTWLIDHDRPRDPFDPGPYGTPGWHQDQRTGRHRRDETPDPLPAEGWVPPESAWYPGIETRAGRQDQTEASQSPPRSDRVDPRNPNPQPGPARPRRQFWGESEASAAVDASLREQAWDHFMTDSAPLAAAHQRQPVRRSRQTALDREAGLALLMWIRLARWLFTLFRSLSAGAEPTPGPHQTPAAGKRRSRLARQRTVEAPTCVATPAPGSVPSGRAAFPQPGVSYGPDRREPTGPTVPVMPQGGPAFGGLDRGQPTSPAVPVRPAGAAAMARAIAGAQRARAGVPVWV